MAEFEKAYKITAGFEGGYVNDPDDLGGETYKGISRVYNPSWLGWLIIDSYDKKHVMLPQILDKDMNLNDKVKSFYKAKYWDSFLGDHIHNQPLANTMFDISVNMGTSRAILFLQKALNFLNRNQQLYPDLVEDGNIGSKTLDSLDKYLIHSDPIYLLKTINILRGMHYLEFMKKSLIQEKYARGWLSRLII